MNEGGVILSHEECIERLPWYLAGSLPAAEAEAVTGHVAGCAGCRDELEANRAAARLFAAGHPAPEALVAHAWGELDEATARVVESHVPDCPACHEELALARASRALESLAQDARVAPFHSPARGRRRLLVALAAAAVLALGVGALGLWSAALERRKLESLDGDLAAARAAAEDGRVHLASSTSRIAALESQVAGLMRPQGGLPVIELLPPGILRGPGATAAPTVVRKEGGFVVLELALERPDAAETWTVRLRGSDGGELWSAGGLRADARGVLALLVPTALLPDGAAGVELTPEGTRRTAPGSVYPLDVRSP